MSHLETALKALRDSSDAQLKKLYVKKKEPLPKKVEEDELSEEDAELLKQLMEE